jgi:hypothetical protein
MATTKGAPWYDNSTEFVSPTGNLFGTDAKPLLLKAAKTIDVSDHAPVEHPVWANYYSVADFGDLTGRDLMDGVYVTFLNTEGGANTLFDGQAATVSYDLLQNHEPQNRSTIYKVLSDNVNNRGIGIYPDIFAQSRVEFLYSTKGLKDVEEIQIEIESYGNIAHINRFTYWNATVYIFNLDGTILTPGGNTFHAEDFYKSGWEAIVDTDPGKLILSTATTNAVKPALKPGDLDNKLILITFRSKLSEPETTSPNPQFDPDANKTTEPLTVFGKARIQFNRPEITLELDKDHFEAGAGRDISVCDPGILSVTVKDWNTLYENSTGWWDNGKPNNRYTAKFAGLSDRDDLYAADRVLQEELAYFELTVTYPFILDAVEASLKPYDKVDKWYTAAQLDEWGNLEIVGNPGVDKSVTYRIPRELFVQSDVSATNPDVHRQSTIRFKYRFAPTTVEDFDAGNYIKATTSAVATDTKYAELSGYSIPTYTDKGQLFFDQYRQIGWSPVTFKNLPNFSTNGDDAAINGGLILDHYTAADPNSTDRYNDDVEVIGWRVEYATGKFAFIHNEVLPKTIGAAYTEAEGGTPVAAAAGVEIIDCHGDLVRPVDVVIRYERGDVNVDDPLSVLVNEVFTIDETLTYNGVGTYTYTGDDLIKGRAGAIYTGNLLVLGNNQYVWYEFKNDDLLSHALGVASPILSELKDRSRLDIFFSPYDETATKRYKSRPHTVYLKASGLKPDVEGGKTATLKVFKERFGSFAWDDLNYHTNGFLFTAAATDRAKAAWFDNNSTATGRIPAESVNGLYGPYKGTAITDTLYYTVDLDDAALVNRLKRDGIELELIYQPLNDLNVKEVIWDAFVKQLATPAWEELNIFQHVAQFGISTGDGKGFNEFYTVGTTDNGLVTTLTLDVLSASYNSFYNSILSGFGPVGQGSIKGIWREAFLKNYGTRYVNTCYPTISSQYIVAGLNLLDPVDVHVATNKNGAFKYTYTPLADRVGGSYGTVVGNKLVPNEYGEALFIVTATFDPADRAGIPFSIYTEGTTEPTQVSWGKYYAIDNISLIPQQRSIEPANRVLFYDLDDYRSALTVNKEVWQYAGIFAPFMEYGANITDTLKAEIKGDVKVPEIYYSTDPEGTVKIETLDFGTIAAGGSATKTIYLQGRDLPDIGTTPANGGAKVTQEIEIGTSSNLLTFAPNKWSVYTESWNLAHNPIAYKITLGTAGATEIVKDVFRGDVIIPVNLTNVTDITDLCNTEAELLLAGVCRDEEKGFVKTLATEYTPILATPEILSINPSEIGGDYYIMNWKPVKGASYYKAFAGKLVPEYTSENIFISEVRADDGVINIELFNGTGRLIHRGLTQNYWVKITKQVGTAPAAPPVTISLDNFYLQGNTQPVYQNDIAYEPVSFPYTATLANDTKYTIALIEGEQVIDIYEFNTAYTWMARKPYLYAKGVKLPEVTVFETGNWTTVDNKSLPEAYFPWEDDVVYDAVGSYNIDPAETSIRINGLLAETGYTIRLEAYNWCILDEDNKPKPFGTYQDIATSIKGGDGNITFTGADEYTSNSVVTSAAVQVIGGSGAVTVLNANGKSVSVANVLGQVVAKTVATSDRVTIAAPKGIVVVSVGGEAVKAVVK